MLTVAPFKPSRPSFRELFTPKLITILREGYDDARMAARADHLSAEAPGNP
jgi:hypothetical protein